LFEDVDAHALASAGVFAVALASPIGVVAVAVTLPRAAVPSDQLVADGRVDETSF
jgi:hypothetical protein